MKNYILIITFSLFSLICEAQINSIESNQFIRVKPIKPDFEVKKCLSSKTFGIVIGFEVIDSSDKSLYGEKFYGIFPCLQYPGNVIFNGEIYDLEFTEIMPKYKHEYPIINKELLQKNINGKEFWIIEIGTKKSCVNGTISK
ncbi:hypothetical protein L1S35_05200 [Flavobacterium sp. AS60]|uniref:hypothetical protein n=1 Tax=Flavobacterium anseongense TaxID=2910677 RepID=UPI001F481794|nr:hypothetical protein [Flavobacterium sp. AS60]MCF6129061.1 hypothetical protein [Flavobacterium sp. AS60]